MRTLALFLCVGVTIALPTHHSTDSVYGEPDHEISVAAMHELLGEVFDIDALLDESIVSSSSSSSSSQTHKAHTTDTKATSYFVSNGEDDIAQITVAQAEEYGLECLPAGDITQSAKIIVEETIDEGEETDGEVAVDAGDESDDAALATAAGAEHDDDAEGDASASSAAAGGAASSAAASAGGVSSSAAAGGSSSSAAAAGGEGGAASSSAAGAASASSAAAEGSASSSSASGSGEESGELGSAASSAASSGAASSSAAGGGAASSSTAASESDDENQELGSASSSAASSGAAAASAASGGAASSSAASGGAASSSAAGDTGAASSSASDGVAASSAASHGAAAASAAGSSDSAASSAASSEGTAASSAAGGAASSAAGGEGAATSSAAGGASSSAASGEGAAASSASDSSSSSSSVSQGASSSSAASAGASSSSAAAGGTAAASATSGGDDSDEDDDSGHDDGSSDITEGDGYGGDGDDLSEKLEECTCVPYYLCREGDVITDGEGLIDIRLNSGAHEGEEFKSTSQCHNFLDVCCHKPLDKPDPEILEELIEYEYTPSCGHRNPDGVQVSLSGFKESESQFGEFPWMAIVLEEEELDYDNAIQRYVCGGSLIGRQIVMTAAHCVSGKDATKLQVRLGDWDTKNEKEPLAYENHQVARMIVHEKYNKKTLFYDVALLYLAEPVELKQHIDTLCLPEPNEDFDMSNCVATGFGKDRFHGGSFQNIMKQVDLTVVPHKICQTRLRTTKLGRWFRLHKSFTCAAGDAGADTCTGDGGSPLACPRASDPEKYVQTGIVAWGIGCGQEGLPGVYASVPKLMSWVREAMAKLERPHTLLGIPPPI